MAGTKYAWLTTHEAAEVIGITDSGARWLADTGQVKAIRTPGGRRLLSAADVDRLCRERAAEKQAAMERQVVKV